MSVSIALRVANEAKIFRKSKLGLPTLRKNGKNGNGKTPNGQLIAVNHVSIDVRRGESFDVLGPNGSGKSTVIRLIATLLIGTLTIPVGLRVFRAAELYAKRAGKLARNG